MRHEGASKNDTKAETNSPTSLSSPRMHCPPHVHGVGVTTVNEPTGFKSTGSDVSRIDLIMAGTAKGNNSLSTGTSQLSSSRGTVFPRPLLGGKIQVEGSSDHHVFVQRIPCKARGMGASHTPQTAYFEIRLGAIRHGDTLVCSHPTCSGSGRRFRYCSVCECPVAKRNFVKRHSHEGDPPNEKLAMFLKEYQSSQHSPASQAEEDISSEDSTIGGDNNDEKNIALQRKRRSSLSFDAADTLKSFRRASDVEVAYPMRDSNSKSSNHLTNPTAKPHSVQLSSKEVEWLTLLHCRPHVAQPGAMERWMETIISVSDPDCHIRVDSTTPPSWVESYRVSQPQAVATYDRTGHAQQDLSNGLGQFNSSATFFSTVTPDSKDQKIPGQGGRVLPENMVGAAPNTDVSSNAEGLNIAQV